MKIVLNPGHGPKNTGVFDPGAVGPTGIKEADINLSVANKLKPLLEAAGIEVLLIRDGDLSDVTNQANASNADYFISLHCNSFSNGEAHGTETYVYQEDSKAKDLFIKSNLRLVISVAKKYKSPGLSFLDLVEKGNI